MPGVPDSYFYFCHIMKTGGWSLLRMLQRDVVEKSEVFPKEADPQDQMIMYTMNPFKLRRPLESLVGYKLFAGHYPLLAHQFFPKPLKTICLFREPVERAVSHLMQLSRETKRDYEALYEDSSYFGRFLYNVQARAMVFCDEAAPSLMEDVLEWDDALLEQAKSNLELIDVIGLTCEFEQFVAQLNRTLGWRLGKIPRANAKPPHQKPVSVELRQRLRGDLEYDIRFYEHVVATCRAQQR